MTVNMILDTASLAWLDEQRLTLRRDTGVAMSRSKLLRGIVSGLRKGGVALSRCKSEAARADGLAQIARAYFERSRPQATASANRNDRRP